MALTREAQQERAAVIKYLQSQLLRDPDGEAEEHWNECLGDMIDRIKHGEHVKAVRRG